MKTLTLELSNQAAVKLEKLEQQHGERLRHILGKIVLSVLDRVEKAPDTELRSLEEILNAAEQQERKDPSTIDFQTAASYVVDTNIELYKRLA
jgi:hypothetical protein